MKEQGIENQGKSKARLKHEKKQRKSKMRSLKLASAFLCFVVVNVSSNAQTSYRSGIALAKSLESTYRHKYEVVEIGEIFLKQKQLFSSVVPKSEWFVLERHLLNYLRIHDDPKIWEREKLSEFGYPEHLPTIKAFLAKSHGTSFQSLPENDIAHQVKNELNKIEGKFKSTWMLTQNLNHYQFQMLIFWEHYLDILATRLSIERAQELGFKYELYSGVEWLIRIHSKHYDDEIRERKEKLFEFEKIYFDFVTETRCHHHLKSVDSKLD